MNASVWPERFDFSMAPFGYVVTVKLVGRSHTANYVTYGCRRESCHVDFTFDTNNTPLDEAREVIYRHVNDKH